MSQEFERIAELLIGSDVASDSLSVLQAAVRAAVVYAVGLAIIRLGSSRLLARYSPFDIILAFVLGSLLSRAINGQAAMSTSLAATAMLVLMHWGFAVVTYHSDTLGGILKGNAVMLIKDGQVQQDAMRRCSISDKDLMESLHLNANLDETGQVKTAFMERNGEIGIVPVSKQPQVVEFRVTDGVQVVRIELAEK